MYNANEKSNYWGITKATLQINTNISPFKSLRGLFGSRDAQAYSTLIAYSVGGIGGNVFILDCIPWAGDGNCLFFFRQNIQTSRRSLWLPKTTTAATGISARIVSSSTREAFESLPVKKIIPMITAINPKRVKADTRTNIEVKLPVRKIDQCLRKRRYMMKFRTSIGITSMTSNAEVIRPGIWFRESKLQYETEENTGSGSARVMTVDSRIKTIKMM